jgi:hypothetical protein
MNPKWKTGLIRRSSDRGFVMPTIVGLGLMMILIGITMVVLSHDNQLTASSQKKTSEASNVAEAGVAEVLSFLSYKYNRALAQTNLAQWNDSNPNQQNQATCNNEHGFNLDRFVEGDEGLRVGKPIQVNNNRDRYKIINYTYNSSNQTGTLVIQGESNWNDDVGKSSSFLQVTVPVNNPSPDNSPVPGLWLQEVTSGSDLGDNKIRGSILVNQCPPLQFITQDNVDSVGEATASRDIPFPPPPTLNLDDIPDTMEVTSLSGLGSLSDLKLPRAGDTKTNGYYAYVIKGDLATTGDVKITIDGSNLPTPDTDPKVIFYVQKNIKLDGNVDINSNREAFRLQIYGNPADNAYQCTPTCHTTLVEINGKGKVKALIYAPDATGRALPDTSGNNEANFTGTVWVNEWDQQNNYPDTKPLIAVEGEYNDFFATEKSIGIPIVSAPVGWQRCSAVSTTTCQQ